MTRYEEMIQKLSQGPVTNNTAQFQNRWMQTYAQPTTTVQEPQQKGGIEGLLGGLGQTIGNVGTSLAGLFGGGVAGIADLATGNVAKTISKDELQKLYNKTGAKGYLDLMNKAANDGKVHYTGDLGYDPNTGEVRGYELAYEGKNQDAFKKMLYGTKDDGTTPDYAKAAGQAADAAATVSNFIPGANGLVGNAIQGAVGAFGQNYADTGGDLESALKAAVAGGAAGLATGGLNKGLNKAGAKIANTGIGEGLSNFANNHKILGTAGQIGKLAGRGALSGAIGGGVGGGVAAGLNGEDILSSAAYGAGRGIASGAMAAPLMAGANKLASKIPGIGGAQAALGEMEQEYQTNKQLKKLPQQIAETTITEEPTTVKTQATAQAKADAINSANANSDMIKLYRGIAAPDEATLDKYIAEMQDPNIAPRSYEGGSAYGEGYYFTPDKSLAQYYADSYNLPATDILEIEVPRSRFTQISKENNNRPADFDYAAMQRGVPESDRFRVGQEDFNNYLDKNGIWGSLTSGETPTYTVMRNDALKNMRRLSANTNNVSDLMYGESELANGNTSKASLGKKIATTLEGAQANLTRKEARDIGIESAGKAIDKTYKRTGITDLQRQAMLANELTGAQDSLLDTIQRTALSATEDGKPRYIDITPVIEEVDSIVENTIPKTALNGTKRQQLIDDIKSDLSNTGIDTITKANNIRGMAMEYSRKAKLTPDIGDSKTASALFQIADKVDDMSYKAVPKDQVDAMYETAISELKGRAEVAKKNGVKDAAKAYNMLADELSNTERTIENYRTFKKDFVNSNKIYTKTAQGNTAWNYNAGTIGAAILGAAITGNPLVGVPAALLSKSLAIPAGEAATQGLAKLGGKISDLSDKITAKTPSANVPQTATTSTQVPSNIYNLIGQKQGSVAASDTLEGMLANSNTEDASQALIEGTNGNYYAGNDVYGNTMPTTSYNAGYATQQISPLTNIELGIQRALSAGDLEAVEYLADLYSTMAKVYGNTNNSGVSSWSSADKKSLLDAQNWMSKIDDLEQVYNNANGARGGTDPLNIGGNLAELGAKINLDKEGNSYQSYANSIGMGIIKNLVNMGGTEYDAERYLDYLPKLSDTKEQAAQKLQMLRNAYQTIINNLYAINQV